MPFLTGQSCYILKSGYIGGGQNKDSDAVSQVASLSVGEKWMLDEQTPKDVCGEAISQVVLTRVKFCVWRRLTSGRNSMFFLLLGLHCLNTSCHSPGFMADKSPVLPWQGCYFTGHVMYICHGASLFNGRSLCLLQNVIYWWSLWLHDGCFTGFLHCSCKEKSTPGMFVNVLILIIHSHILITILVVHTLVHSCFKFCEIATSIIIDLCS